MNNNRVPTNQMMQRNLMNTNPNMNPNANEFCNWGVIGPKIFECRGKKYAHGSTYCPSGSYENIFCEDRLSANGRACQADQSPDTVFCRQQFQQSQTANVENEFCDWGIGPEFFECQGKVYVYGSADCPSGFYSNIFCEERYSNNGRACQDDRSQETVICNRQFQQQQIFF